MAVGVTVGLDVGVRVGKGVKVGRGVREGKVRRVGIMPLPVQLISHSVRNKIQTLDKTSLAGE